MKKRLLLEIRFGIFQCITVMVVSVNVYMQPAKKTVRCL